MTRVLSSFQKKIIIFSLFILSLSLEETLLIILFAHWPSILWMFKLQQSVVIICWIAMKNQIYVDKTLWVQVDGIKLYSFDFFFFLSSLDRSNIARCCISCRKNENYYCREKWLDFPLQRIDRDAICSSHEKKFSKVCFIMWNTKDIPFFFSILFFTILFFSFFGFNWFLCVIYCKKKRETHQS